MKKGPLAFWFLNHDLEETILLDQMKELKAKGFAGFFLHSRGGLKVPYGSRRWHTIISYCVMQAKKLGLEAWLYDEDPYPSGAAGGRVTMEHPEYRASELLPIVISGGDDGKLELDLPQGTLIAAYLVAASGSMERVDEAAGMIRSRWSQHFSAFGYYAPYHHNGSPHWRAETSAPHYRILMEELPPGSKLIAFIKNSVIQNPWGEYPDLLNADAVELFIRYTHDTYAKLLGPECGATVPGIFTDEAKLKGRLPWSDRVPGWFHEIAGTDFFGALPHLILTMDARTPFYRWAYRKALARGFCDAFVEPMVNACRRHRLMLTGHVSPEEDPVGQALCIPGLMGVIGQMDLPGTDLIGASLGSREQPLLHFSPKVASSAAHGHGKRWVTCEAFAVCDWAQDLASLTRAVHWLYALGVNRLVTHGQFYSIDGLRKREAPPSQFIQASYWEHFGAFSGMVELLSRELGKGTHQAPLLVYYPEDSFMAMIGGVAEKDDEAYQLRNDLGELVHSLLTQGYDFDFADEPLLHGVTAFGGQARLQEENFEAILVPGRYLSEAAWQKLQQLESEGVPVLYMEEMITVLSPQSQPWKTGGGQGVTWDYLRQNVEPLWQSEADNLIGHLRRTDDGPLLFLCNNGDKQFRGHVTAAFPGPYEMCHPQEGVWETTEQLDLQLAPGLGVLIRQQTRESMSIPVIDHKIEALKVHWGEWQCKPCSENCVILGEFRATSLSTKDAQLPTIDVLLNAEFIDLLSPASLTSPLVDRPGDRAFLAAFDWHAGNAPVRLVCDTDLGEGGMEFYLNGMRLPEPTRRKTFDPMNREVNLASFVKQGRNHLLWIQRCGAHDRLALPYDALRLFGDFHVEFPFGRPAPARLTARPPVYRLGFPTPASQMGHPHYGGLIAYENRVRFAETLPERLSVEFERVFESMEVRINGSTAGWIWSAPWRVEIPSNLLKAGAENILTLICSCSPATYLQALQRPSGFLGPIRWRSREATPRKIKNR